MALVVNNGRATYRKGDFGCSHSTTIRQNPLAVALRIGAELIAEISYLSGAPVSSSFNFVNASWFSLLIGVAGTTLGATLSFVLYRFALRDARPVYKSKSFCVVGDEPTMPAGVAISFNGEHVAQITKSILLFWNAGRGTVTGAEIVSRDCLRAEIDGKVLTAKVIARTRDINSFNARLIPSLPSGVLLEFDFLDAGDGVAIELLHTGSSRPHVLGTIRGIPSGPEDRGIYHSGSTFQALSLSSVIEILLSCMSVWIGLFSLWLASTMTAAVTQEQRIYFALGSITLIWIGTESVIRRLNLVRSMQFGVPRILVSQLPDS